VSEIVVLKNNQQVLAAGGKINSQIELLVLQSFN